MTAVLFALLGGVAGAAQGWLLARRAGGAAGGLLRLLCVGAVLIGGALCGHVLAAAAGWAVAFPVACGALVRRL